MTSAQVQDRLNEQAAQDAFGTVTEVTKYDRLAAPFDVHHTDVRGGVELTYISGEQVISRLNEVLGVARWSFKVLEHGINAEADECWALGQLTASIDGEFVTKEQFGSQKVKRSRSTGALLDLGFDLKGAGTDAMKKCASLIGIGLYLTVRKPAQSQPRSRPQSQPARANPPPRQSAQEIAVFRCVECHEPILAQSGEGINKNQAGIIRERYGKLICREHRPAKVAA